MEKLVMEKVNQAIDLMKARDLDTWVVFTHETGREADQTYPILMGERDLGGGILLLTRSGRRVASSQDSTRRSRVHGRMGEVVVYTRVKRRLDYLTEILRGENPGPSARIIRDETPGRRAGPREIPGAQARTGRCGWATGSSARKRSPRHSGK